MSNIDLGDIPTGSPPTEGEKTQIREILGLTGLFDEKLSLSGGIMTGDIKGANLLDDSDVRSLAPNARTLNDSATGAIMFDWSNPILAQFNTSITLTAGPIQAYSLRDTSDKLAVDIISGNRCLYDNDISGSPILSADWNVRKLYNSAGNATVDWENGYGLANDGNVNIYWGGELGSVFFPIGYLAATTTVFDFETGGALGDAKLEFNQDFADESNGYVRVGASFGRGIDAQGFTTNNGEAYFPVGAQVSGELKVGYIKNLGGAGPDIDLGNAQLFDSSLDLSIDWGSRQLCTLAGGGGTTATLDWYNCFLRDTTGVLAAEWGGLRYLYADDGAGSPRASINWQARQLIADDGSTIMLDWSDINGVGINGNLAVNTIFDASWQSTYAINVADGNLASGAYIAVDYANRNLFDSSSNGSVDWEGRTLKTSTSVVSSGPSVDWANRKLYHYSENTAVDWENCLLNDSFNVTTLDWGYQIATDTYNQKSLDWTFRDLIDSGGLTSSLNWSSREMYDSFTLLSIDWESRTLNNSSGLPTVDWGVSALKDSVGNVCATWGIYPGTWQDSAGAANSENSHGDSGGYALGNYSHANSGAPTRHYAASARAGNFTAGVGTMDSLLVATTTDDSPTYLTLPNSDLYVLDLDGIYHFDIIINAYGTVTAGGGFSFASWHRAITVAMDGGAATILADNAIESPASLGTNVANYRLNFISINGMTNSLEVEVEGIAGETIKWTAHVLERRNCASIP